MSKWKRLMKQIKKEAETLKPVTEIEETKLPEPEEFSRTIEHQQEIKNPVSSTNFKPKTIFSQIPRYAYLLGFFVFLSGIFHPLITPGVTFDAVVFGTATLFLGLVGGIILFKATTSVISRGIFISVGLALIATSLVLIILLQEINTSFIAPK